MFYGIKTHLLATPTDILHDKVIVIRDGKIENIVSADEINQKKLPILELEKELLVFPALINPHDHLLGSYWPRVGEGPHLTWKQWDDILKSSEVYKERSNISNLDLYRLGAFKNLFSGVVTVMDHFPHELNEPYLDKLPIRVIREYTLSHEVSAYELPWGRGVKIEHQEAKEKGIPFVTHIEEGFDEESKKGIDYLIEYEALDEYTVMVHGLALSEEDIDKIAKAKAHLVWCPTSNYFMFKTIAPVKKWLEKGINVSLGTDSPMSGGLNILEEMKFAKMIYKMFFKEELSDEILVKMVTVNPAKAFRIDKYTGSISIGKFADLLVIRRTHENPYTSLVNAWFDEIELVIMEGKPLYGYMKYEEFFEEFAEDFSPAKVNGKMRYVVDDPVGLMFNIWEAIKYRKQIPFFPVQPI